MRVHWGLDPDVVFLNHGSFGATPIVVLERQAELRRQLEREPVRFFMRELEPLLDRARHELADFVRAAPEDIAFVPNATTGVSAVLRSLELRAGDELLTTDHAYNACKNALEHVAARAGATVKVAEIPLPIRDEDDVTERVLSALSPRSRLLMIDHVTSPTGLIFPVERIVREVESRGVRVLVDGAHAPGQVPLDLGALGASYYTANCHKWMCAPKGCAMLWVRSDLQREVRPAVISHGANSPRRDRSRFLLEFDWTGTLDPTPYLCVGDAIRFIAAVGGGWDAVRAKNRALALEARALLSKATGREPICPPSMIGSMAAVRVLDGPAQELADALFSRSIEVPVFDFPRAPSRLVRVSAHLYNECSHYESLAQALPC